MKTERRRVPAAVPHEDWLLQHLRNPGLAAEYLNASLAEGDQAAFLLALRDVAKARGGFSEVARQTGLDRVALSRSLSARGNPELHSLNRILEASGLRLVIASTEKALPGRRRASTPKPAAKRVA